MGAQMIEVKKESEEMSLLPFENCCFCGLPTQYWYEPNDVACCEACAETAVPEGVPTKKEWLAKEQAKEEQ